MAPPDEHEVEHHIHESPKSMTVPLLILAFFSIFSGWMSWPHSLGGNDRLMKFVEPVFAREASVLQEQGRLPTGAGEKEEQHTSSTEYLLMLLSSAQRWWAGAWRGPSIGTLTRDTRSLLRSARNRSTRALQQVVRR